jgi:hypothetical protein
LQQDELDIQFGFDLSIWILAARKGEVLPSFPHPTDGPSVATASTDLLWDKELDSAV